MKSESFLKLEFKDIFQINFIMGSGKRLDDIKFWCESIRECFTTIIILIIIIMKGRLEPAPVFMNNIN